MHIKRGCWFFWGGFVSKQPNIGISLISLDISFTCNFSQSGASFKENNPLQNENYHVDLMLFVLKLPWTHTLLAIDNQLPWKIKCLSLQVLSKLGPSLSTEAVLEVLDLGLHDKAKEVRTEAAISMPVMVLWSGLDVSPPVFERME